jgi:Flp pilus assembly protein TadD
MRKRTVIAVFIAFFLTVGFTALWSAEGDEQEGDTASNIVAANADGQAGADGEVKPKKKGSRWGRFFKAPFRAVGKVFGGGDDKKMARMTEEDAQRFESVGVERVEYDRDRKTDELAAEGSARDYLNRGRAHLESGNLNEAVSDLSRAASLDPRLTQAHSLLAVAYERKGLHDRARASFERAADMDERDPQALNNLGYSLYLNGNYRAAVDKLKKAAKLAPNDARIFNNLALAQCRLGKYDDAYKSFARAGGDFNGHVNVAALLERVGRDEAAVEHLEKARRLQPNASGVLSRLADIYERTGKASEAQSARQALEVLQAGGATVAAGGGR